MNSLMYKLKDEKGQIFNEEDPKGLFTQDEMIDFLENTEGEIFVETVKIEKNENN